MQAAQPSSTNAQNGSHQANDATIIQAANGGTSVNNGTARHVDAHNPPHAPHAPTDTAGTHNVSLPRKLSLKALKRKSLTKRNVISYPLLPPGGLESVKNLFHNPYQESQAGGNGPHTESTQAQPDIPTNASAAPSVPIAGGDIASHSDKGKQRELITENDHVAPSGSEPATADLAFKSQATSPSTCPMPDASPEPISNAAPMATPIAASNSIRKDGETNAGPNITSASQQDAQNPNHGGAVLQPEQNCTDAATEAGAVEESRIRKANEDQSVQLPSSWRPTESSSETLSKPFSFTDEISNMLSGVRRLSKDNQESSGSASASQMSTVAGLYDVQEHESANAPDSWHPTDTSASNLSQPIHASLLSDAVQRLPTVEALLVTEKDTLPSSGAPGAWKPSTSVVTNLNAPVTGMLAGMAAYVTSPNGANKSAAKDVQIRSMQSGDMHQVTSLQPPPRKPANISEISTTSTPSTPYTPSTDMSGSSSMQSSQLGNHLREDEENSVCSDCGRPYTASPGTRRRQAPAANAVAGSSNAEGKDVCRECGEFLHDRPEHPHVTKGLGKVETGELELDNDKQPRTNRLSSYELLMEAVGRIGAKASGQKRAGSSLTRHVHPQSEEFDESTLEHANDEDRRTSYDILMEALGRLPVVGPKLTRIVHEEHTKLQGARNEETSIQDAYKEDVHRGDLDRAVHDSTSSRDSKERKSSFEILTEAVGRRLSYLKNVPASQEDLDNLEPSSAHPAHRKTSYDLLMQAVGRIGAAFSIEENDVRSGNTETYTSEPTSYEESSNRVVEQDANQNRKSLYEILMDALGRP
ncbi:hypothetical protein BZG36_04899, partial [Bifiguratus adelaidae]